MGKILLSGGSGFIGGHLCDALLQKGYKVVVLDRRPPKQAVQFIQIDLTKEKPAKEVFEDAQGLIHLVGKNIFTRWSPKVKKEIYDSRILSTRNLVSVLEKLSQKPKVFVSASAVGYYGDRGEEELTEDSLSGDDFLARLCQDWEKEARSAEIRSVQIRTAPVLGSDGFLKNFMPLFKFGLGGVVGNGKQWMPWIHIQDIVGVYVLALENENLRGPIIASSPQQVRFCDFVNTLAKTLHGPAFFKYPIWLMRLIFNDLADTMATSQKIYPKKLVEAGYQFRFPELETALRNILSK